MGKTRRPWRKVSAEYGYLPHFQRVGRVCMEVRFIPCSSDGYHCWKVVNTVTGECGHFRKNGTPLDKSRGKLVGPLIHTRKITRSSSC